MRRSGSRVRSPLLLRLLLPVLLLLLSASTAAEAASSAKRKGSASTFERDLQRRRGACAAEPAVLEPCAAQDVDQENCILKCLSAQCYAELFPEPIEDGEVVPYQGLRFKRCLREADKLERNRASKEGL